MPEQADQRGREHRLAARIQLAADRDNATSYRQLVTPTDAAITATTATLTAATRRADSQYRTLLIPCALLPP